MAHSFSYVRIALGHGQPRLLSDSRATPRKPVRDGGRQRRPRVNPSQTGHRSRLYRAVYRLATTRLSGINLLEVHPQSGARGRLTTPRLGASGGTRRRWVDSRQAPLYPDFDGLEFKDPSERAAVNPERSRSSYSSYAIRYSHEYRSV